MPRPKNLPDRLNLRIDPDLRGVAQKKAEREGLTLSEAIRRLLELWIEGKVKISG
jgi:antitoxin component of RelBE/YafQ-DinJ toxin-antitoxin module